MKQLHQHTKRFSQFAQPSAEHARGLGEHAEGFGEHARCLGEHARGLGKHAKGLGEHAKGLGKHPKCPKVQKSYYTEGSQVSENGTRDMGQVAREIHPSPVLCHLSLRSQSRFALVYILTFKT
ncbi:MAG: hypothetical protein HY063_03405 [Bacteroidetes bacterium]|nr:hypothetical protein [Bacteroidota bacterium]